MNLYIAAASHPAERPRVDAAFAAAAATPGVNIVGDWRKGVDEHGGLPEDPMLRLEAAVADLDAIEARADALWLLVPEHGGVGCWVEFGYALAQEDMLVVSSGQRRSIFTSVADELDTDDAALRTLAAWALESFKEESQ